MIGRIDAADWKHQEVTASFLQDNRWRVPQIRKTLSKFRIQCIIFEKSFPGRDEDFRRSVEKLPEFLIPRRIFSQLRCSSNPDDPHKKVYTYDGLLDKSTQPIFKTEALIYQSKANLHVKFYLINSLTF